MIKNALTSTKVTRETLSRREFLAGSAAVGATIMTGALPAAAQEKTMKKTFTILHTNDMHSAFIGLGRPRTTRRSSSA